MSLETKLPESVKCSKVDMEEIAVRFAPVLQKYYDSFQHLKPETDKEKILALQIKFGRSQFQAYGNGETLEMERKALEFVYLIEEGLVR